MEKNFDHYDLLRWELFERLFPKMLLHGSDEVRDDFFRRLRDDSQGLTFAMFESLCMEDKVDCPYKAEDFQTEVLSRGNIGMVKIQPPEPNPDISISLRAYVVYSEKADKLPGRLYFIIKRFKEGQVFLMYVNEEEALKVEELTDHAGDMEFEYWRIAVSYARISCDRMMQEQAAGMEWSRDWKVFDWDDVEKRLDSGSHDIGITRDEWLEYMQWFSINDPEGFAGTVVCILLKEMGFSDKEALYYSEHADELAELLKKFKEQDRG